MDRNSSIDFFISYNELDKNKAAWIGITLEENDYNVWLPDWDIHAGNNEILSINKALADAIKSNIKRRVILVLSPNFKGENVQENMWASVIAHDPDGAKGLLIPVIVRPNPRIPSLLHDIKPIDLSVCKDEVERANLLLEGVSLTRHKPNHKPNWNDDKSSLWSDVELAGLKHDQSSQRKVNISEKKTLPLDFRLGLLDKKKQVQQIVAQVPEEHYDCKNRVWGFLLTGRTQEWPRALKYKLAYVAEMDLKVTLGHAADLIELESDQMLLPNEEPARYLWRLLGFYFNCPAHPSNIVSKLECKSRCQVFYRVLSPDESDQDFLAKMLAAWLKLQLAAHLPSHFLLFIRQTEVEDKPGWMWYGKKCPTWFEKMQNTLLRHGLENCLLPPLETPTWDGDINDWLNRHVKEELHDSLKSEIDKVYGKATAIPHGDLKTVLLPLLESLEVTTRQG